MKITVKEIKEWREPREWKDNKFFTETTVLADVGGHDIECVVSMMSIGNTVTKPPLGEIEVTEKDEFRGTRQFSYKPARPGGGGGWKGGAPKDPVGMRVGNAMTNAVNLVCHGKIELGALKATALRIATISGEIEDALRGKGDAGKSANTLQDKTPDKTHEAPPRKNPEPQDDDSDSIPF